MKNIKNMDGFARRLMCFSIIIFILGSAPFFEQSVQASTVEMVSFFTESTSEYESYTIYSEEEIPSPQISCSGNQLTVTISNMKTKNMTYNYDNQTMQSVRIQYNSNVSTTTVVFISNYSTICYEYALSEDGCQLSIRIPLEKQRAMAQQQNTTQANTSNSGASQQNDSNIISNIISKENSSSWRDVVMVPVPSSITMANISNRDLYEQKRIEISINTDLTEYCKSNKIISTYNYIKNTTLSFNKDVTKIVIDTKKVCGYEYFINDGYLVIRVDQPGKIYDKIVVIDAGHGGNSPGAIYKSYVEKNLTFKIVTLCYDKYFKQSNIKTYLTRSSDRTVELTDRVAFANEVNADLFVSLHLNAAENTSITGTEVYYNSDSRSTYKGITGQTLATKLSSQISTAMNTRNRGAKDKGFVVLQDNKAAAVLIEVGFLTNANERTKLLNEKYQEKVAKAIYDTVKQVMQ